MSQLSEKINSYALEKGMILGQSLNFPEPETGSYPQTTAGEWVIVGQGGGLSISGPRGQKPDQYNYRRSLIFQLSAGNRARFNFSPTNFGQAFVDHNFSMGFWFRINDYTYANNLVGTLFGTFPLTQGGFSISHNTVTVGTSRIMVVNTNSQNTVISPSTPPSVEIPQNEWHYVAFIRQGSTMDVYLNGVYKTTMTGMITATAPTNLAFGNPSAQGTSPNYMSYSISNFYVTTPGVIGPTQIQEIWDAGNTAKIINYYDGSAWKEAYTQYTRTVSGWSTVPPTRYWDGTNWIATPEYDQTYV